MIAGEPPLGIGCRSGMVLRKSFFFFLLRRPRPTLRRFLSPFLLPATLLLLHPLSIPPIPIRILFPFANPQYVSGPSSTPLGDAKGKSRPKERHGTGPELSTLIHSDSVPPSRYLLSCFLPLGLFREKNLKSWKRTGGGLGEDEKGGG